MSRNGHASPGNQATQSQRDALSAGDAGTPRSVIWKLVTGVTLCVVVLVLGVLARTALASFDLRTDQHVAAHDRTSTLTAVAKVFTDIGKPETVGVGLMFLLPIVLLLFRRRLDALKVFCMFAGAFTLVEVGKYLIDEHRPPVSLQLVKAGGSPSFPSGHATAAAVLAVALVVIAATVSLRITAVVLGGLYAIGVAASRVYLGDHFPTDVLGGMLCALAAAFIVTGLASLPVLQPHLRRFGLTSSTHRGQHR